MERNRTDGELLGEYARSRCEAAFAEVVGRHVGWVHAAARRQVRDADLARDVTQEVFLLLSRKAGGFARDAGAGPWLFRATRFVARDALRARRRRARHETKAGMERITRTSAAGERDARWEGIEAVLEDAVAGLRERDRRAVLLRFYERRSFAEVAAELRTSEAGAQMRVGRAVERLRAALGRRGVIVSAGTFGAAMWERVTPTPPGGLAGTVAAGVAGGGGGATAVSKGVVLAMISWKAKAAALAVAVMLVAGAGTALVKRGAAAAAVAAEADAPWRAALDRTYRLEAGQVVRRVAPPLIPERMDFFRATTAGDHLGSFGRDGLSAMVMAWDAKAGRVGKWILCGARPATLGDVLPSVLGVRRYEIDGPREILGRRVDGDWVVDAASSADDCAAAVERLSRAELGIGITVRRERVAREAIVVGGVLAPATGVVQVYSDKLNDGRPAETGREGTVPEFLRSLAEFTEMPLVDERGSVPTAKVRWAMHASADPGGLTPAQRLARVDMVLANVSRQTGLAVRRETRIVERWVVRGEGEMKTGTR